MYWYQEYNDLLLEWDHNRNSISYKDIGKWDSRKIWWICKYKHQWKTTIESRIRGSGCPYCSGRKATKANNLAIKYPILLKEWNYEKNIIKPNELLPFSNKKVWWICEKKHEWESFLSNRTRHNQGCPYCVGKRASKEYNLEYKHPYLVNEYHKNNNIKISDITPKSHIKVLWKCINNHEWKASVSSRTHSNTGCPICAKQFSKLEARIYCEIKKIFGNVVLKDRSVGFEIDIYLPDNKIGIEVDGYYWHKNLVQKDIKKNLAAKEKNIRLIRVRELNLNKISEDDIVYDRNIKQIDIVQDVVKLLCQILGFKYEYKNKWLANDEYIDLIKYKQEKKEKKFKDKTEYILEKLKQYNLEQEFDLKRNKSFNIKVTQKVWWICNKGHRWKISLSKRQNGTGCPYCTGNKVLKKDSVIKNKSLMNAWNFDKNTKNPEELTLQSNIKVWWKCDKNHDFYCSVYYKKRGKICPACKKEKNRKYIDEQ